MEKLYFADGYHGGIKGHMPNGVWYDVLDKMEEQKDWKLNLEIEPVSWDFIRKTDNRLFKRIKDLIENKDGSNRAEIVGGSFAQPFCWAISGESNIRQLIEGMKIISENFPSATVETYSCQEPCFTSALPQILVSLGFKQSSTKNPTMWGGYIDGHGADGIVNWVGPDGTKIPCVPRYECEDLIRCNATEGSGYDWELIKTFADKCASNGIKAPVGLCYQDLGWAATPQVHDSEETPVEYITWKGYFKKFGNENAPDWNFSQEDVLVSIPWGNQKLQEMSRYVRESENRIIAVEKVLAIAESLGLDTSCYSEKMKIAWENLMLAQHHDAWICALSGGRRNNWAWKTNAYTWECDNRLKDVLTDMLFRINECSTKPTESDDHFIRIYNTVGNKREGLTYAEIGMPKGYKSIEIYDMQGNLVPSQTIVKRRHADGTLNTVGFYFRAACEGVGYTSYIVKKIEDESKDIPGAKITAQTKDVLEIETDLYSVRFDLKRGGRITRLYDKAAGTDFADEDKSLMEMKGFFIDSEKWKSSADAPARAEVLENGPLLIKIKISGKTDEFDFENVVTFKQGEKAIEFMPRVYFSKPTNLGFPYTPTREESYTGRERSNYTDSYKLGLRMPLSLGKLQVYKNAPFDVCESRLDDTDYYSWDGIKHNIVLNWVDLYDKEADKGFAVLCDHTNGYAFKDNEFSLTLAWGYHANYWWGYSPANGDYFMRYAVVPHAGKWNKADVAYHSSCFNEPMIYSVLPGEPKENAGYSLICAEDKNIEVAALKDGAARLFNWSDEETVLKLKKQPSLYNRRVNLDGTKDENLDDGDKMGRFRIVTLK